MHHKLPKNSRAPPPHFKNIYPIPIAFGALQLSRKRKMSDEDRGDLGNGGEDSAKGKGRSGHWEKAKQEITPTEGHKDHMSQRKTQNAKRKTQNAKRKTQKQPHIAPHPINFFF